MGTFKYRESIDSPWQELPVIGDIYTQDVRPPETSGGSDYPDIWYNAETYNSSNAQYHEIDVSNCNTLSFVYDYTPSSNTSYKSKLTIKAQYGYEIVEGSNTSAKRPAISAVDESTKTEEICYQLATAVKGTVVELDVSSYTKLVLHLTVLYTTSSTNNYGCLHIYDITRS